MGAEFNCVKLKGKPKDIQRKFEELQQRDLFENGHCYSGGFGMAAGLEFSVPNRVFTSDEARQWLLDKCEKWEAALAVKLGDDEYMVGAWCAS